MPVEVAGMPETTALGAAAAAGVGAGLFTIDDLAELAAGRTAVSSRVTCGAGRAPTTRTWRRFAERASLL